MNILSKPGHRIGLFGVGLIGSAIRLHLWRRGFVSRHQLAVNWSCPEDDLNTAVRLLTARERSAPVAVSVVWSAGACGFGSAKEQTNVEESAFALLLKAMGPLSRSEYAAGFHLVSSAGALFEGQRGVTAGNVPVACRPYAELKLAQESMARQVFADDLAIYRPTSVYGHIRNDHRIGLVSALIKNSIERRVTHLVGRTHTLRDYVCADDIGAFIAANVTSARPETGNLLLAQGKPSSVFEIQKTVESILRQRAYISYNMQLDNDRDTTFSPSGRPSGWRPQSLDCGVRAIADVFRSARGRPLSLSTP